MTTEEINKQATYIKDNIDLITKALVAKDDPEYIGLYATKETLRYVVDIVKSSVDIFEQSIGVLINEREGN